VSRARIPGGRGKERHILQPRNRSSLCSILHATELVIHDLEFSAEIREHLARAIGILRVVEFLLD
jgi:hypothetical protein